jgi:uncharacterized protein YaaN involved in tellurite resistance
MNHAAQLASSQFDDDAQHALHHAYLSSVNADRPAVLVELDPADSQAVALFGSDVQERLLEIAGRMLEDVRAEDTGELAEALRSMASKLHVFEASPPDQASKAGWLDRLLGRSQAAAEAPQDFEKVCSQIEALSAEVHEHRSRLLAGIESSDRLYTAGFAHLRELEACVSAADFNLAEIDAHLAIRTVSDDAPQESSEERRPHDLHGTRENLRRRLRDLRVAAQVTRQTLSSVCLVQENDEALVGEISSKLTNAMSAWRQQLAQATASERLQGSAVNPKVVELSNGLLLCDSGAPLQAGEKSRRQIVRGVGDAQLIREANRQLLETIEDQLSIAKEARIARQQASRELSYMEQELRWALSAAKVNEQASKSFA